MDTTISDKRRMTLLWAGCQTGVRGHYRDRSMTLPNWAGLPASLIPQKLGEKGRSQHRITLALTTVIAGEGCGNFLGKARVLASKRWAGKGVWAQLCSVSCSKWKWEGKIHSEEDRAWKALGDYHLPNRYPVPMRILCLCLHGYYCTMLGRLQR